MQKKIIFTSILLLVLTLIVVFNFDFLTNNLFFNSIKLEKPYKAITDSNKNNYIIDLSKRRIIKIDSENRLNFKIDGGLRKEGSFFYANDIVVDNYENLYVLNLIPDNEGFYTKKEEILKFSYKGDFIVKIYEKNYEEEKTSLVQRGQLTSLMIKDGVLSWFDLENDGVVHFKIDLEKDNFILSKKLLYENANIMLYDVKVVDENRWVFSTKRGEIQIFDFRLREWTNNTMVNDQKNELKVCYSLFVAKDQTIYYTDIGNGSLYKYVTLGKNVASGERVFSFNKLNDFEDKIFYFVDININEDNQKILTTSIGNSIINYNIETNKLINSVNEIKYKKDYVIKKLVLYLFILILFFLIVYTIIIAYSYKLRSEIPPIFYKIISIIIVVAIATTLIVTIMISDFSKRYEKVIIEKISSMVQLISKSIDGNLIENIKSQKDFMGENYQKIRNSLNYTLNYNKDQWNKGYYYVLYRLVNNTFCGFMYLSDEIGPTHPFRGWYEEENSIPSQAFNGKIVYEKDQDEFGTWIYSMGPIKNSKGEVVAIIEIGTDLYSFNQENKKLIMGILLDVFTMLIVLILMSIEIVYFGHLTMKRKEFEFHDYTINFSYSNLVRPFYFLFSSAICMSIVFVPIMMKNLYTEAVTTGVIPIFGLPQDIVIALPISIEMLFFGIALFIGGILLSNIGWRLLQIVGITFAVIGLFLSGYSVDIPMFLFSRGIVGFGSGLVLLTARSIINFERDPDLKSSAYSNFYSGGLAGITVGAVFGGFFADYLGFSNVFYIAVILASIAGLFAYRILIINKNILNKIPKTTTEKSSIKAIFKFLFNIKILSYFLLAIIPTYSAGMFLSYYLPLFAESKGINTSDIGRLFMLHGLLIIYLGPVVSRFIKNTIKDDKAALILGSIGWAISLVVFAVTGNITGLIITLVIMALTEGFCVVSQNDYFLNLKVVKEIGEDKAISYFEITAKIAEIIAPIIFGWVLITGATKGMWFFGLVIATLSLIFLFISNIKEVKKNE